MSERWKNLPFLGSTHDLVSVPNKCGTGTHGQRQSGTSTSQSGTSTHSQKGVGIGTNQSGIDTDASSNLIFVPLHC